MTSDLDLAYECGPHIDAIMENFTDDCLFTLIIRKPGVVGANFVISTDSMEEVGRLIPGAVDRVGASDCNTGA